MRNRLGDHRGGRACLAGIAYREEQTEPDPKPAADEDAEQQVLEDPPHGKADC